jgi:hypothetical protein
MAACEVESVIDGLHKIKGLRINLHMKAEIQQ